MATSVAPGAPRALLAECTAGDSAALFERHSVEEIRGAERAVRADIEHKKEELRLMVGERYRDLMEAADTMAGMRASAERVRAAVRDMGAHCQGPQPAPGLSAASPGSSPRGAAKEAGAERGRERFFALAAQVRLVLGVPERIWGWLEAGRHLEAARLCLLCRHVMASLGVAGNPGGPACPPLLARFPLLARQAAAAAHFRSAILQESRAVLRVRAVADQAVTDALCAVMLLEEASPRQAFADFLLARKSVVQGLLNEPQHGSSIKAQVCTVVESVATTLYQVHAVFYSPPGPGEEGAGMGTEMQDAPCGLLISTLESLASDTRSGTGQGVLLDWAGAEAWGRHLPPDVLSFRPVPTMMPSRISLQHLRHSLLHWVTLRCREDVSLGVRRLLPFVRSLRGLAGMRDAVWELLASEGLARRWTPMCAHLLGRPLSLWDEFLQPLFMQRVEELLQETLDSIAASSQQALQAAVLELGTPRHRAGPSPETDASTYLWTESPGDLAPHAAWGGAPAPPPLPAAAASSQTCLEVPTWAGLTMKARGHTPMVQGLCAALDAKLRARIEDVAAYLPPAGPPASGQAPPPQQDGAGFDRFADSGRVQETLQKESASCITALSACARGHLDTSAELLQEGGGGDDEQRRHHLAIVLFVARLCRAIPELCPSLRLAILGSAGAASPPEAVRSSPRAPAGEARSVPARRAYTAWTELSEELGALSLRAYDAWSRNVAQVAVSEFGSTLRVESPGRVLGSTPNWDEIEIMEETESGGSVASKIHLPAQASFPAQALLFGLGQAMGAVGAQAVPRVTRQALLEAVMEGVLTAYEARLQPAAGMTPMCQARALQLLFDLRFMHGVLAVRPEGTRGSSAAARGTPLHARIQAVVDDLESHVDPFDLDVFTPHLHLHLQRLLQRTNVLFGVLTGTERQYTGRPAPSGPEAPSLLAMAATHARFALLPLPASSLASQRRATPPVRRGPATAQAPVEVSLGGMQGVDTRPPGALFRQLASHDEGSQPGSSLFKLGWLSAITK
ncbi:conserved oligomeric Golgi complex subunit 1 isoform X3 [Lampetra fluviatilis]